MISLFARFFRVAFQSRTGKARSRNYRPWIEALEDRLAPSTTSIIGPGKDGAIPVGQSAQIQIITSDFIDNDINDNADLPFQYSIHWNDGTADSTGTLTVSGNQLTASLTHTLAQAVTTVQFTLTEAGEGDTATEDVTINGSNIAIAINKTADKSDNVALYNPLDPNGVQTIQAEITNFTSADATIRLQAISVGSGSVTVDGTPFTIPAGGTVDVTITPTATSSEAFDVHIDAFQDSTKVGEDDMTVVHIVLPKNIRNADTPDKLPDRIPPRKPTAVHIGIAPDLGGSGQFVTLKVAGQDADNGMVTFNGQAMQNLSSTGDISLSGAVAANGVAQQTTPGFAGHLELVVQVHGQDAIKSKGFSVSAIPQNVSFTVDRADTAALNSGRVLRGFVILDQVQSDSGDVRDIQGMSVREEVQVIARVGTFLRFPLKTQFQPVLLNKGKFIDTHAAPLGTMDVPGGALLLYQTHVFRDDRTSVDYVPIANSGFIIAQTVTRVGPVMVLTIQKSAAAVSANGFSSKAGTGFAKMTFKRLLG